MKRDFTIWLFHYPDSQARVLILDEATSSLGMLAETLIQEALQQLMQGHTTFVVAHRLATIRGASRVAVLAHGRMIKMGKHEKLIHKGGMYSKF